jgi:hypothetical protein
MNLQSGLGFPGADDPAYGHELAKMRDLCRDFIAASDAGDFDVMLFVSGQLGAQQAAIWLLSPPGGILDPITLYEREGERCIRVPK